MSGPYDTVEWRDRYSGFAYRVVEQNQGAARQFVALMEPFAHRYRAAGLGPPEVCRALSEMAPMVRELAEISAAHINQALQIRRQNIQNQFYVAPRDEADYAELRPRGPWIAVDPARGESVSFATLVSQADLNTIAREEMMSINAQMQHRIDMERARVEFMRGFNEEESQARFDDRREQGHRRIAAQEAAKQKSLETFLAACSPAQRTQFEHSRGIDVEVKLHPDARRNGRYHLIAAKSFSVTNVHTGEQFCAQIEDVPIYDQMLGLKLMLENDPVAFFEVANSNLR